MEDRKTLYSELYYMLFNRITDAVQALDKGLPEQAREILCQAQLDAEEQYIKYSE